MYCTRSSPDSVSVPPDVSVPANFGSTTVATTNIVTRADGMVPLRAITTTTETIASVNPSEHPVPPAASIVSRAEETVVSYIASETGVGFS